MSGESIHRSMQAAADLDRAYRAWRGSYGFAEPAETSALPYVTYLPSVRLRHSARVLFGLPAHEAGALARFLETHAGPEEA